MHIAARFSNFSDILGFKKSEGNVKMMKNATVETDIANGKKTKMDCKNEENLKSGKWVRKKTL